MAALERTTVRRARVQRRCGEGCCPVVIKPDDLYLEHVVSPGHPELGNTRWRRLAECSQCAKRYGRDPYGNNEVA
jgi:hypothetical protein